MPIEVVIIDNCSTDDTAALLARLDGASIERQTENLGFVRGCNRGATLAHGTHLLFLNNDTVLLPGALPAAVANLRDDVGAVGGRLVFPDGRLQEAGSIVWRDGSCAGYGRGESPWAPEYSFRRDVDYCSAAFLLTPRSLFSTLGGFDEQFAPAYYEDVDYCVRLRQAGWRVIYEPAATVVHDEFASAESSSSAMGLQLQHRARFVDKHRGWLDRRHPFSDGTLHARSATRARRLLFIEDRVPHSDLGSGYPRSIEIIRHALGLGYEVTLYPLTVPDESWERAYQEVPPETEIMVGLGPARLSSFLADRRGFYDVALISRPHNMRVAGTALKSLGHDRPSLVYDAEAIFALRDVASERLRGVRHAAADIDRRVSAELALAKGADVILTVSALERRHFIDQGFERVMMLGTALPVRPGVRPFKDRKGLVFVGAVLGDDAPNADAVLWFLREILPIVRSAKSVEDVPVTIAGKVDVATVVAEAQRAAVTLTGPLESLTTVYEGARVFIAPTRFSAGVPLKILDAASHGVPAVSTTLLAEQLSWVDGRDLLTADTPHAFADACLRLHDDERLWTMVRNQALERVRTDYSPEAFRRSLHAALRGLERGGDAGHVEATRGVGPASDDAARRAL
jgi:GT2 family glycosyltransferase